MAWLLGFRVTEFLPEQYSTYEIALAEGKRLSDLTNPRRKQFFLAELVPIDMFQQFQITVDSVLDKPRWDWAGQFIDLTCDEWPNPSPESRQELQAGLDRVIREWLSKHGKALTPPFTPLERSKLLKFSRAFFTSPWMENNKGAEAKTVQKNRMMRGKLKATG